MNGLQDAMMRGAQPGHGVTDEVTGVGENGEWRKWRWLIPSANVAVPSLIAKDTAQSKTPTTQVNVHRLYYRQKRPLMPCTGKPPYRHIANQPKKCLTCSISSQTQSL